MRLNMWCVCASHEVCQTATISSPRVTATTQFITIEDYCISSLPANLTKQRCSVCPWSTNEVGESSSTDGVSFVLTFVATIGTRGAVVVQCQVMRLVLRIWMWQHLSSNNGSVHCRGECIHMRMSSGDQQVCSCCEGQSPTEHVIVLFSHSSPEVTTKISQNGWPQWNGQVFWHAF